MDRKELKMRWALSQINPEYFYLGKKRTGNINNYKYKVVYDSVPFDKNTFHLVCLAGSTDPYFITELTYDPDKCKLYPSFYVNTSPAYRSETFFSTQESSVAILDFGLALRNNNEQYHYRINDGFYFDMGITDNIHSFLVIKRLDQVGLTNEQHNILLSIYIHDFDVVNGFENKHVPIKYGRVAYWHEYSHSNQFMMQPHLFLSKLNIFSDMSYIASFSRTATAPLNNPRYHLFTHFFSLTNWDELIAWSTYIWRLDGSCSRLHTENGPDLIHRAIGEYMQRGGMGFPQEPLPEFDKIINYATTIPKLVQI